MTPRRSSLRLAAVLTALVAGGGALAQTAECQRFRAELASLGRAAASSGAADQQRVEIARLNGYYQSIGCGRGQFLFFGGPPPECPAIAQRINMMQVNLARLTSEAQSRGGDARRRQLVAAMQQACNPHAERRDADPRRLGGGRLVCVRACDGFFFPLHNLPANGRSGADEMCQALCPGAEAAAYRMPTHADAELTQAVSLRGKPYTRLANAFKFQKGFDGSCSCKKDGQTWVEALAKAEKMIGRGRGDVVVTAKKAEELSRPRLVRKPGSKLAPTAVAAKLRDVETTGSIVPAKAEAGDGAPDQGTAETGDEAGEARRAVRVVGPTFMALPQATPAE
jgi:hypothetical protein